MKALRAGLLVALVGGGALAVASWRRSMLGRATRGVDAQPTTSEAWEGRTRRTLTRRMHLASERAPAPGSPDALRPGQHVSYDLKFDPKSQRL